MNHLIKAFLVIIGTLLCLYSAFLSCVSNINVGVVLPVVLGLPLLISGIFYKPLARITKAGWGRALKISVIACYCIYILIFSITSALLYSSANESVPGDADALIVLGAAVQGDRPSLTLIKRLETAYDYLSSNPNTIAIVSGGQGEQETIPEAEAMAYYLIARGIDETRIYMEDKASSTEENFKFSKKIIEQIFDKEAVVAFITSDFHVFRAERVAMRQGLAAKGIASPSVYYMLPSFYLRETVAVWVYWLRGWL